MLHVSLFWNKTVARLHLKNGAVLGDYQQKQTSTHFLIVNLNENQ